MLLALTSPIAVAANHGIAESVKCYGPDIAHNRDSQLRYYWPPRNVTCRDLACNSTSKPLYCWIREMLRALTSNITVQEGESITG